MSIGIDPRMITRKIFLASSSELKADRDQFEIFINRKNNEWHSKEIFLRLILWEDFIDAMSQTRLQDEYNKAIVECDIFVTLFSTKVGRYTEEEFKAAFGQFKAASKPLIFTYFKDVQISIGSLDREDTKSLWNFQDQLKSLGHFQTVYKNVEELQFKCGQQLNKLEENGFFTFLSGQRVLALWPPDRYWYPGTVVGASGKQFSVEYDDGQRYSLTEEDIRALELRADDVVECRWTGGDLYYPAHFVNTRMNHITVEYDCDSSPNGPALSEKELTKIEFLRFLK
jgi:hypothetical protein